ncbi:MULTISPECIES: metal ABC transporter permease [unclassified Thermosynechococcus]|uniref:metal ABC transporter permease n=1 Tax=unclassified Thermosynechococcus TaxID=2622553 RepID=UPI00122DE19D|nr:MULTISPECIES: metal ABC transporter permease [unclassified Thermosynechococcus]QEQ00891.1 metal ABC transporter permease [Thermosynechococcus sp. CL-1]QSF48597.1 metal ABC transporter permease [Thermosynechococcus sp. TA-1]WNC29320.1 metal ABC transporter permease [Thermosynechococcus sp. PKX82]WNC31879.1 metal ABC transporter permease [Thermosynechococcus sp. PKX95]WNC34406.1 metal ABC transporter permease [Thermosynechococcus sp. PKX91]
MILERMIELLQLPFMQRALWAGIFTGGMAGALGSFTILRQLSFFSDALGHSALLGISLGIILGLNPSVMLLPFAVVFALGVTYLLEHTRLWTDALLNIIYSASLALAVILLSMSDRYQGGLNNLLFGDILAVRPADLVMSGMLCALVGTFILLTLRVQLLITVNEALAVARGAAVGIQRLLFITLLALVVAVSIKTVGVLLISAFVVIPACGARLWSRQFSQYVVLAALVGVGSAIVGMLLSAGMNWPSGPSIVVCQLVFFLGSIAINSLRGAWLHRGQKSPAS